MSNLVKIGKELEINKVFLSASKDRFKEVKLRRALTIIDNNNKLFQNSKLTDIIVVPRYTVARTMLHAGSKELHFEFGDKNNCLSFTEKEVLNNPHMFIIGR